MLFRIIGTFSILATLAFAGDHGETARTREEARPAAANKLKSISKYSDASLTSFAKLADSVHEKDERFTAVQSYRIMNMKKKEGESDKDAYARILKFAMHRDYPITGDDGGYSLDYLKKNMTEEQIARQLDDRMLEQEPKLVKAIKKALNNGLYVIIGVGAGNNTRADYVTVIDPTTDEFVNLISSNFGSDD